MARLRAAGCVFAEDEAALLIAEAGGAVGTSAHALESMLRRRERGEPLEQVLGWAAFEGLRVAVAPGVFVPRTRSGWLVRKAAALARAGSVVVDLGCGTGALGLAVAARVPGIELHAADVDPDAVAVAEHNLAAAGFPAGRVHHGDLFDALPERLRGRIDVVIANAPYVPTAAIGGMPPEARDHEHRIALDGGADGVDVHRRIGAAAAAWLAPTGRVLVETSAPQTPATLAAFRAAGLTARAAPSIRFATTAVTAHRS